jgi:hypothetical protein
VLNGRIGKVQKIYVVAPPSKSGGVCTPEPPPAGIDWDKWLGPAPKAPYCKDRVGDGIFNIRDYSLGFIANWGVHPMDQLQWWADNSDYTIPVTYEGTGMVATGGLYDCTIAWDIRCTYHDGLEMHYMDSVTFRKKTDVPRVLDGPEERRLSNAVIFVGSEGKVINCYEKILTEPASLLKSEIKPSEKRLMKSPENDSAITGSGIWDYPAAAHQLAWLECLKSGKPGVHSIETAFYADMICQLSDLCVRTGAKVTWDNKKRTVTGNAEAAKMMSRPMRSPWNEIA